MQLTGIYATLRMGQRICKNQGITSGKLILACDNITAGITLLQRQFPITPKWNNFDLISAIHWLVKSLPFLVVYKHVQGHQKERNPHSKLDGWAIMNDEMDRVAKAYLHHTKSLAPLDHIINSGEWAVWIQRNKIMSNLKHFLVQAI